MAVNNIRIVKNNFFNRSHFSFHFDYYFIFNGVNPN